MGFIAKVRDKDPECFDYPFFVTSHELAHQWWGHQVAGGHVQGASMLSESLAEYSALMVQEKEYGPKQMRKFLKYELDHYLTGRGSEDKGELPLELDEGQDYIHYNKGSLVFYALKDYMGEDTVNRVLREYIRDIAFQQPPFTRAIDLVERFKKAATTPELKVLIEDLFERITIYDNRTDSIDCRKVENHYQVTIKGFSRKLRADEAGKEIELPMHELVDVGLFDQDNNILYLKKHIISTGNNEIRINVSSAPSKGGIDPLNKLIDKVSSDNLIPASAPER